MNLNNENKVGWSLKACMRIHGVKIRQLAKSAGLTMKRIREVRAMKEVGELTAWEYVQMVKKARAEERAEALVRSLAGHKRWLSGGLGAADPAKGSRGWEARLMGAGR